MFPHNRSSNGFEPKSSTGSARLMTSGDPIRNLSGAEFAFQSFSVGSSIPSSISGSMHTTQWMATNQEGSKQWQGQPHKQSSENHHDSRLQQKVPMQNDHKHRDYLKQQQRLKALQLSSGKQGVSADALIGNLLEKKDTFIPKQHVSSKQSSDSGETLRSNFQVHSGIPNSNNISASVGQVFEDLPVWLNPGSSRLPPIYAHIWSLVCDPSSAGRLVDTNKILALLLTSSLPKEILGFIWNLATNGSNNQLNQQQLYITLALVALAQMGCTFNNLSVLNYMPQPPIPSFNMNISKPDTDDRSAHTDLNMKPVSASFPTSPPPLLTNIPVPNTSTASTSAQISVASISYPMDENDDDFGDFTHYQSAEVITIQPPVNLSTASTLPSTTVVQPSITAKQVMADLNHSVVTKLGRNHGRSIGSRLANYTLGAPKSRSHLQKHRRSSVDHDNAYMDDEVMFSRDIGDEQQKQHTQPPDDSENDDFSDFQIAAGLNVDIDELFPKCNLKTNQKVMLKESAIRTGSSDEVLKEEQKYGELLALDSSSNTTAASIPAIPVLPPPAKPTKELMSVEEDKYSALRFLEIDSKTSLVDSSEIPNFNELDDFGDFVSADDLFAEIAVRDSVNHVSPVKLAHDVGWQTTTAQAFEFPVNDWGGQVSQQLASSLEETDLQCTNLTSVPNVVDDLSSTLSNLDFSSNLATSSSKLQETSDWSFDLDIGKHLSDLSVKPTPEKCSTDEDDEFGDFVGPQTSVAEDSSEKPSSVFLSDHSWVEDSSNKLVPGLLSDNRSVSSLELPIAALSRHGSLPSLDLNIFPVSDDVGEKTNSSQILDWIRCLESCVSLLQAAYNTFSRISSHSVLMEVLGAPEGHVYLVNLLEVHRVTWRIQRSFQRFGQDSNQVETLVQSINRVWSSLKPFYTYANIETAVENDGSDEESGQPACGVCGSPASRGVLEYGGHAYHAPCANLWVNCVDRTLPVHSSLL